MSDEPDFEKLRAERNERVREQMRATLEKLGWLTEEPIVSNYNFNKCYCACTTGGPCEHKWDGEPYEDDRSWSLTCSRCGMTAMSHSLHTCD